MVTDYRNIVMFKSKTQAALLTDQRKINLLNTPDDILAANAEKELSYSDYEIWVNDSLVTRFSKPIYKAIWYPDLFHIVYQQGDEIRVVEKSGFNETLLVKLNSPEQTPFVIGSHGDELYFFEDGKAMSASIR
jgi:hypothetical protein